MNQPVAWSKDEMQILFEGRNKLPMKPYSLLAEELGRHPEAVRDKYRKTDWAKAGFQAGEDELVRYVYKSKFTGKAVNRLNKKFDNGQLRVDAIADVFERSLQALPTAPKAVYKPLKKKRATSQEDVALILSDLHVGHEHTMEETGISEYNMSKFKIRMENLKEGVVEIAELHKKLYELPRMHIFCLGDVVAGMNEAGAWSPLYINYPIVDQMLMGFEAIADAIYYWLGMFGEIHFYGITGNHGRAAPSGVQKDHDNWDYVCYKFLEERFRSNPRVKFNVPKPWWSMHTIRNHNFLLVHGDYARGGKIPLSNLATFEQKMSSIVKSHSDYLLAGHFHNAAELATNSGRIIVNGSFVGSDVYSLRNCHAASKPEQKLFGIHDRHGITWTYNVNLDIPRGI